MGSRLPYGERVATHGLGASHRLILDAVPPATRVIDIGCATGYLAARLAEAGCSVVGFERDPAGAAAAEEHCTEVVVGDIEAPADRERLPRDADVVIFGDVLEHVADPWEVLAFARSLLAPGGVVIVSIPNVAAWPVRFALLAGRFEYTDFGLLDRTHLRFFTRASALELAQRAGYVVERARYAHLERAPGPIRRKLPLATSIVDRTLARVLPGLFAQQFVLTLRPRG